MSRNYIKRICEEIRELYQYGNVVECGEYLDFNGVRVVVSPFITGQGHTQKNYKERLDIASELIKNALN